MALFSEKYRLMKLYIWPGKIQEVCSESYLQEWNCHQRSQSFHCGIPSWLEASFIRFRRGLSPICCIEELQVTPNMRRYIVVIVFMSKLLIRMRHFVLLYIVFIWKGLLYPNIDLLRHFICPDNMSM